jgi:hypothetical protein
MLRSLRRIALVAAALLPAALVAQTGPPRLAAGWADDPPALSTLVAFARTQSDFRLAIDRYLLDKAAIERRYEVPYSPAAQTPGRLLRGLAAPARRVRLQRPQRRREDRLRHAA